MQRHSQAGEQMTNNVSWGKPLQSKQRHLPTGEQRTGSINRGETEQQGRGTHFLKSTGWAKS